MLKRFFRIAYFAGILTVFIAVVLIGYTQTRSFHASLQDYVLSHYRSVLNGDLSFSRIEGNLITGFQVYDVSLAQAGDSVLKADRIDVTYEPFGLFFKRVSIGRVSIVHPHIQLYRSTDSSWNISRLFVPSSDTSTSAWTIAAKNVQLVNARVTMVDSLVLQERAQGVRDIPPAGVVDYAHVSLDSLYAEAGFQVRPVEKFVQVRSLSFLLDHPRIRLRGFQGDFKLNDHEANVSNLKLMTDRTRLGLDVALTNVDIASLKKLSDLKTKPVRVNLQVENLDTQELKEFLYPWVDFLNKSFTVGLYATGEFGKLNIHEIDVRTAKSQVVLAGTISNLHKPKDLQLDVYSPNSVVDPADANEHLPGLSLPNLEALGRTRFRLTFKGAPTDFDATVNASTDAGTVDVAAGLRIGRVLEYKTSFVTGELDLGKLLKDDQFTSRLNLTGTLNGAGTDGYTTTAVARVEVDSSEFWGMPIGQSAFVFDLNSAVLRSHAQLRTRSTLFEISNQLQFAHGDSVSYTLNGSVNSLNLADIFQSSPFRSDLSFTVRGSGTGMAIDRLNHSLSVNFVQSSFGDVPFEKGGFDARLNLADDRTSHFTFRSEPLDVNVDGKFSLPALVENIIDGERIVSEGIAHRIRNLDSLRGTPTPAGTTTPFSTLQIGKPKYVDVAYQLEARNLIPVGVFFQWNLAGSLSMSGTVKGTIDSLEFSGDSRVQSFVYTNGTDSYGFANGTLQLDLANISRTRPMEVLNSTLTTRFDRFSVNKLSFYNTSLAVTSRHDSGSYEWSALIDSTYQLDLRASSLYRSNIYTFEMPQFRIGMDFYILENNDPVLLQLGKGTLFIKDLMLSHEAEELGVAGYFSPEGESDLKVTVNDFLLNNLKSILNNTKLAGPVKDLNGILNANLSFKGTMAEPEMALDVTTNGFRSRSLVFGQVVARSTYANHLLSLFVELRNKQREQEMKPDLLISGTVPYELSLAGPQNHKPQGEINLTMYSKGLSLEFLDPFLPSVSNLSGTLICDMRIHGTVDAPTYEGNVTLHGAKFLFDPLGIYYIVHGKLIPSGSRVGLEDFVVRNLPQDRTDGQMTLSGTFSLANLRFGDFNLQANGQLMVMKESSRLAGQKFYGDLFLATGPNGVRWQGQLSNSRVGGDVLIKYGKFVFPPEREAVSVTGRAVNVIFRDDTSKPVQKPAKGSEFQEASLDRSTPYASLEPVPDPAGLEPGTSVQESAPPPAAETKSFLDNIAYDLNIDVQSPTSLLFVFNTQPSEELFADLRGKLAFSKNTTQTRLTGEVNLESRSYYYFFKRFDASGKINFTTDPVNPELDVTAKYEGTHTIDTLMTSPGMLAPQTVSGQRLTSERVDVLLQIAGTKNKPKTKFGLEFPDRDKNSQYVSKDPDGDAMSFLLTGYLKDELDPQQRGSYLTVNMLSSLTAGLITGPLTNALKRQISAIQSVDLQYYGGEWNKTDLRVTAEISSAVIRFGGRVIEGINNTNVSVEVPVGNVFGLDRWRNLLLKYERKVDAVENIDQRIQSNSLSVFYRFVF